MAQNTINVRASNAAIREALLKIPAAAVGGGNLANALMTRAGMAALGRIRAAFVIKARGGTDEAGDKWAPLSPKTIAYSKTRQRGRGGRTKTEKGRASSPSQALTKRQQDRWWAVYRQGLAMYDGDKGHAAARAWLILKGEGATTLLEKYGHRQVEILRDTGLLLNSLSPGVVGPNNVFRITPGAVIIGTNRKGAMFHHRGVPGRLPQRRLWPPTNRWPASWWRDIIEQIKAGLIDITLKMIKDARP